MERRQEIEIATEELCLDVSKSSENGLKGKFPMKMDRYVGNLTFNVYRLVHGLSHARCHLGNIGLKNAYSIGNCYDVRYQRYEDASRPFGLL